MFKSLLNFFSSLRLTVVCLCFALVLVFAGTLAQVDEGLYNAQNRWFRSLIVTNANVGKVHLPFFPGGYLIGGLLLINLFTAHAVRFKFSKKKIGIFVIHAGLVLLFLGQFATDILSQESQMQLFEGEKKNYSEAMRDTELALIDTSDANSNRVYSIPESLLKENSEIKDAQLPLEIRVKNFWPNCTVDEHPPAEAIPAGADHGLFTNLLVLPVEKSATASEESGAAVLVEVLGKGSLGTFLVPTQTQRRQKFKVGESEWSLSLLYAPMMGGNNFVVADAAGSRESMILFPEADLTGKTELKRDRLPFTLQVKNFWPSCRLYRRPAANAVEFGSVIVTPEEVFTDTERRNLPGAIVELSKDQVSIGTFLLNPGFVEPRHFTFKDKPYEISLRFKREYYPFSLTLLKATHEKYKGTDVPKNFASRIRVENPEHNEARETMIYMNNPLRYSGLTFFQYQMAADEMARQAGQMPSSTFQIVRNPSWLTPYVSCLMVAAGLIIQFMSHLIGFVMKRREA